MSSARLVMKRQLVHNFYKHELLLFPSFILLLLLPFVDLVLEVVVLGGAVKLKGSWSIFMSHLSMLCCYHVPAVATASTSTLTC